VNNRDKIFFEQCNLVAKNSKCLSRKIGSVLVRDNMIIGTGYNGPPRGMHHCECRYTIDPELKKLVKDKGDNPHELRSNADICPRYYLGFKSGEGLDWCVAGHAERNVLINCARMGISTKDTTMYMNCPVPCTPCLVEIINAGVRNIVVTKMNYYDQSAKYICDNSDLNVRTFNME